MKLEKVQIDLEIPLLKNVVKLYLEIWTSRAFSKFQEFQNQEKYIPIEIKSWCNKYTQY